MSPPALAARRGATALLLMARQRGAAAAWSSSSLSRPFSSSGAGGTVVEVVDDAALTKALADCAASGAGSVVNFSAAWCGPCKAMNGPVAALAKQHAGRVSFLKVDIDSPALQGSVAAAGVSAVPTYVVRRGAQVLETIQGARLELLQKAVEQAGAAK